MITRSLKRRLIVGLMLVCSLFWLVWLGFQVVQRTSDRSGAWDAALTETGKEILLSLPRDFDSATMGSRTLKLPPSESFKGDMASYQVWVHQRPGAGPPQTGPSPLGGPGEVLLARGVVSGHRNALHSPGAPSQALRADFTDGCADAMVNGEPWRVYAITDSTGQVQVQIGKRYAVLHAELAQWTRLSLVTALLLFLLLAGTIGLIVCWSLKPVTELRDSILKRNGLDMQPLPTERLPAEVAPLVDAMNRLLAQLEAALQAERRFIADAAHELRTPLAALLNQAQMALAAPDTSAQRSALLRLKAVAERSARLSEQMLNLARLEAWRPGEPRTPVDLSELVMLVLRDFEAAAASKRLQLVLQAQPCPIDGHIDALGILIRNLIDNAVRYTPDGGRIVVQCAPAGEGAQACVPLLRVADNGPGVPREERSRIFDRFYRVAGNGAPGSGIGLSLVHRIVRFHGAHIEVGDGIDGRGFGITLRFPAAAA